MSTVVTPPPEPGTSSTDHTPPDGDSAVGGRGEGVDEVDGKKRPTPSEPIAIKGEQSNCAWLDCNIMMTNSKTS